MFQALCLQWFAEPWGFLQCAFSALEQEAGGRCQWARLLPRSTQSAYWSLTQVSTETVFKTCVGVVKLLILSRSIILKIWAFMFYLISSVF